MKRFILLLLSLVLAISLSGCGSTYNYQEPETITVTEYVYIEAEPMCWLCDERPQDSTVAFGLCGKCAEEHQWLCNYCGENFFYWDDWYDEPYFMCSSCAGELFSDPYIWDVIERYWEGS